MDTDANCLRLFSHSFPSLVGWASQHQATVQIGETGHEKISGLGWSFGILGATHLLHHLASPTMLSGAKTRFNAMTGCATQPILNILDSNRCQSNSKKVGLVSC